MFSPVLFFLLAVLAARGEAQLPEPRLALTALSTGQYFLFNSDTTWDEGMNYCALQGGHMAVVNSVEQGEAVKSLLATFKVTSVHIGFHDKYVESEYIGVDGGEVDAANWAPGFPKNNKNTNCGGFNQDGAMDIDCTIAQKTICQLRSASSFTEIAPHGWFDLHIESRLWQDAWEICRGEGGHLWIVDTAAEAKAVISAFPQIEDVWIGVHRLTGDDAFINVHGKPLNVTGFSDWLSGYPFGTSLSRPFVALKDNGGFPQLWTSTPSLGLPFMCERATV